MSSDSTGIAGPHPDIRRQICDMANMLVERAQADGHDIGSPPRPFAPDDVTIVGQRTWHHAPSIYPALNGGKLTVALAEAQIDGQRFGGMVEAVINPGNEDCAMLSASFGPRHEKQLLGGDSGGAGRHYLGLRVPEAGTMSNVRAIEVEYIDGTIHRAEQAEDGCVILFSPAPGWDEAEAETTIRWLDASGAIVDGYSRYFNPGPRPEEPN